MADLTRAQTRILIDALLARGFDMDRLAEIAKLHPVAMHWLADGNLQPTPEIRKRLAEALGVDPGLIE